MAGQKKKPTLRHDRLQLAKTRVASSTLGMAMGGKIRGPQVVYIRIRMGHMGKNPQERQRPPAGDIQNAEWRN